MQKLIRRTILAEKQAARRLAKKKDIAHREERKSTREQVTFYKNDQSKEIRGAKKAQWEDYALGPLAPKRDAGLARDTYGTIDGHRLKGPNLVGGKRREATKQVGGKYLNIVTGDRVVLLEGRDKGKIGVIASTNPRAGECTVKDLNMVDVKVPGWILNTTEEGDRRPVRSIEMPVPLTSVRLVFALKDKETGIRRDVIVKELINTRMWRDRHLGTTRWSRMIPGLNIKVPWPTREPKKRVDYPSDTYRMEVEVKSFLPTLLRPPMPGSVIDELRNKYSKFRTRHDPEYIEAKIKEDMEKEEKKKMIREMWTPLKEINRRERKLRRAKGKGKLTRKLLTRIGEVIAKKRQLLVAPSQPSMVEA